MTEWHSLSTCVLCITFIIRTFALSQYPDPCSLNGDIVNGKCQCDPGWKGLNCTFLKLGPVSKSTPGYYNKSLPTWSGADIFYDQNEYHLIVGAKAIDNTSDDLYLCNSNIVHLTSKTNVNGPYEFKETILSRFHLSPFIAKHNGTYIIFDVGYNNVTSIDTCEDYNDSKITYNESYNTVHITYNKNINAPLSEWIKNEFIAFDPFPGFKNRTQWDCYIQNPTAYIYPNGTTIMIYRGTECDPYARQANASKEHIGVAIAKHWKGPYQRLTNEQPLFGWNAHNEDPYLWRNHRGFHLLMHSQITSEHKTRGGYAYSIDGISWILTPDDPWVSYIVWNDGTNDTLVRRQKPGLVFDDNKNPIYLINGVDFNGTDGTKWGTGWTLMQPILP